MAQGHRWFRIVSFAGLGLTYVTMLLGGNVVVSGSGLACPDWPTCDGSLFAPFAGAIGIEWSHRIAALVLGLNLLAHAVLGVAFESRRPVLRTLSLVSFALVVLLALVGGLVIESQLALLIVLLHFGLATVLFGTLLLLVILANLREIPRAWIDFLWRASEDRPRPDDRTDGRPSASGGRSPSSIPSGPSGSFHR